MLTQVRLLFQDLQYAARGLLRAPGFAAFATAIVAIGISTNVGMFSIVNAVLLRPLPFPESDRIVQVVSASPMGRVLATSIPRYNIARKHTGAFEILAAYEAGGSLLELKSPTGPVVARAQHVSREYFPLYGVNLLTGAGFTMADDTFEGPAVVILSEGVWSTRYGRDPNVAGRRCLIGDTVYRIVGVAGRDLAADPPIDLYLPLQANPNSVDHTLSIRAAGRLNRGSTLHSASLQLRQSTSIFNQYFPYTLSPFESLEAASLREITAGRLRPSLVLLLSGVAFLLVITCANLAGLLMTRGARRQGETATRAALGASRARLLRLFLLESLILAFAGGALGTLLGWLTVRVFLKAAPFLLPTRLYGTFEFDYPVALFAVLLSLLTGLLFGIFPSIRASRADLNRVIQQSSTQQGSRRSRMASVLVAGEVAVSLILLVGAATMLRTFIAVHSGYLGFEPRNVLTFEVTVDDAGHDGERGTDRLRRRLCLLPEVAACASTSALPLEAGFSMPFAIDKLPFMNGPYHGVAGWRSISPQYFRVMRTPLIKGRWFDENDLADSITVVIVNRAMADRYWPGMNVLGESITIGGILSGPNRDRSRRIIGIVANARGEGMGGDSGPAVYVPQAQVRPSFQALVSGTHPPVLVARTVGSPESARQLIIAELQRHSREMRFGRVRPLAEAVRESLARVTLTVAILSAFACIGLLVSCFGIYSSTNYAMEQRTREIGIRIAIGATPGEVRGLVLTDAALVAAMGIAVGGAGSLAISQILDSTVYGIRRGDPYPLVMAALLLAVVALMAAFVPAQRAARVDPIQALRQD